MKALWGSFLVVAVWCISLACTAQVVGANQLIYPDMYESFNRGVEQGQAARQRALAIQQQQLELQRQQSAAMQRQRLSAIASQLFNASSPDERAKLLGEMAAIDPDMALRYQRAIPVPPVATQPSDSSSQTSNVYKCWDSSGAVFYSLQAQSGCIVVLVPAGGSIHP